jgi:hypothetical protein
MELLIPYLAVLAGLQVLRWVLPDDWVLQQGPTRLILRPPWYTRLIEGLIATLGFAMLALFLAGAIAARGPVAILVMGSVLLSLSVKLMIRGARASLVFDQARGQFRRGFLPLGRLAAIQAIEWSEVDDSLRVVWAHPNGQVRRSGVSAGRAKRVQRVGQELADELGIPLTKAPRVPHPRHRLPPYPPPKHHEQRRPMA